jgi:hypothetical protein
MPSFLRTSAGTEICPCAVTLDFAMGIGLHYPGNACMSRLSEIASQELLVQGLRANDGETMLDDAMDELNAIQARIDQRAALVSAKK